MNFVFKVKFLSKNDATLMQKMIRQYVKIGMTIQNKVRKLVQNTQVQNPMLIGIYGRVS